MARRCRSALKGSTGSCLAWRSSIPLESDPTAAAGGESVAWVRVTGLPFAAVDYLAGQEGRIAALLGAQLDEFLLGFRQQAGENQPALVDS